MKVTPGLENLMGTEIEDYQRPVTNKGTVTIPLKVRNLLGIHTHSQIRFRIVDKKRVELLPPPMTLEESYGYVKPVKQPLRWKEIRAIAHKERAQKVISEMQET